MPALIPARPSSEASLLPRTPALLCPGFLRADKGRILAAQDSSCSRLGSALVCSAHVWALSGSSTSVMRIPNIPNTPLCPSRPCADPSCPLGMGTGPSAGTRCSPSYKGARQDKPWGSSGINPSPLTQAQPHGNNPSRAGDLPAEQGIPALPNKEFTEKINLVQSLQRLAQR